MRMLIGFFRAPWYVPAIFALIVFVAGYVLVQEERKQAANRAASLEQGPPPRTDLADFDFNRDTRYNGEVNLEVYVDPSLNTSLTYTTKRRRSESVDERMLYFLFDPSETRASGQLRAVMMIDMDQVDDIAGYVFKNRISDDSDNVIFALSGSARKSVSGGFKDLIDQAVAQSGLTKSPHFVIITPWIEGREAALETDPSLESLTIQFFGMLGGGLTLLALLKFLTRGRGSARAPQPKPTTYPQTQLHPLAANPGIAWAVPAVVSPEERALRRKKVTTWAIGGLVVAAFIYAGGLNFFPIIVVACLYWLFYTAMRRGSTALSGMIGSLSGTPRRKDPFDRLR
jgi:hypothetical protein